MQLSRYNKTSNIRKRLHSHSNHNTIELPHINRTLNVNVNESSQIKSETENLLSDKYSWVLEDTNYLMLDDKQIYREYDKLRKQIFKINDFVAKQLQKFPINALKKRQNTQFQTQKVNEVREKEIQNNLNILSRMKKEFKGLKTKSQNITPKQDLEAQISQTKTQINNVKKKIISLKLKNKNIGNSIIGTDQIIIQLQDTEKELEIWQRKKTQLQNKLQKVQKQQKQIIENLQGINPILGEVDSFTRKQFQTKKTQEVNKKCTEVYQQKMNCIQILKRNINLWTGIKQKKYHQLLNQLDNFVEKQYQIESKINEVSLEIISSIDDIRTLQEKLKFVKNEKNKLSTYQKSVDNDRIVQKLKEINRQYIPSSSNDAKRNGTLNSARLKSENIPTKRLFVNEKLYQGSFASERNKTATKIRIQSNYDKKSQLFEQRSQNQNFFSTIPEDSGVKQVKKVQIKSHQENKSEIHKFEQNTKSIKRVLKNTQPIIVNQRKLNEKWIKKDEEKQKRQNQKRSQNIPQIKNNPKQLPNLLNHQPMEQQIDEQNQLKQQFIGKLHIDLGRIQETIDKATEQRLKIKKNIQAIMSKKILQSQQVPEEDDSEGQQQ